MAIKSFLFHLRTQFLNTRTVLRVFWASMKKRVNQYCNVLVCGGTFLNQKTLSLKINYHYSEIIRIQKLFVIQNLNSFPYIRKNLKGKAVKVSLKTMKEPLIIIKYMYSSNHQARLKLAQFYFLNVSLSKPLASAWTDVCLIGIWKP